MRNVFPSEPIKERERNLSSNHKKKQIKKKSFYGNSASRMCFEPYTRFKTKKHVTL